VLYLYIQDNVLLLVISICYRILTICVDECVRKLYDAIYECFELFVSKYMVKNCTVKYPWFDRELHNVDNNKTKAHKYLNEFKTLHVHPMSESDQPFSGT
jgi:hypothetical protein